MEQLVDLDAVGDLSIDAVGGKGLNLGLLRRAGLPVPEGFCVTTAAYATVVGTRLDGQLAALPEDPAQLGAAAAALRERVLSAPLPDALATEIRVRYDRLGGGAVPVAVRSSATAEDLPSASFAGQQDTYLNVVGGDALLDAVRRCWASLWTER